MPHPYQTLIPQVIPFELSRIHLLTQIETHNHLKLIALIAPSGYGKTTLLAQYARAQPGHTVWLTLGEEHADPTYFAEQLRTVLGLSEDTPPTGQDLAHKLNLHFENITLILDEADHLGKDAAKILDTFIRTLGEGHMVCLAAHSEVQLKLSRLAAQGQAFILTTPDLAFQDKESQAYLLARGKDHQCGKLHLLVEGWPVGLSLIASSGSAHLNAQDYILDILDELPREISRSLPELAVLDVWFEGSPGELGLELPEDWLQHLRKQGLPMTPLGGGQYRLHSLLRHTLLEQLRNRPQVLKARHAQVARMAEKAGQHLKAIHNHLQAEQYPEACHIAETVIPRYDVQGFELLVKHTLEAFPFSELSGELQLILIETWLATGEVAQAEQALSGLDGSRHVRYPFTRLHLLMRKGQLCDVQTQAREAAAASTGLWNLKYRRVEAQAELLLGHTEHALTLIQQALSDARMQQELTEVAGLLYLQSSCLLTLQHWQQAEQCLKETRELCKKLQMTPRLLHVENTLAGLHLLCGQVEAALTLLQDAIPLAHTTDAVMLDYLLTTQGDVHLAMQDHLRARDRYQEALKEAEARGRIQLYYQLKLNLFEVHQLLGENQQAIHHLQEVQAASHHTLVQGQLHFTQSLTCTTSQDAVYELQLALEHPLPPLLKARVKLHLHHHEKHLGLTPSADLTSILSSLPSTLPLQRDLDRFQPHEGNTKPPRCCTPTVNLTTLGALKITYQNTPLKFQYTKSAEILTWLVLNGASTRDQIINALWDGSNDPKHINYFKVAMRALRTAFTDAGLGLNPVPFENNMYYIHPDIEVHMDVLTLLKHARGAQLTELRTKMPNKPLDFLPGVHSEWVLDMRDSLTQDLIQYTLKACQKSENIPEAVHLLENLSLLSPLQEEVYLQAMDTLDALGRPEVARQVFQRYDHMLQKEFGSLPDQQMRLKYANKN